jgi:hypothetical protein
LFKEKIMDLRPLENLELTPVRMYGGPRLIGFYGDVFDHKGQLAGRITNVEIKDVIGSSDLYQTDVTPPPLQLKEDAVQKLFQDLWNLGFRPDSGEGNVGQLGATKDHLNDMRKLVQSCLGVEL